jgi:hypothetical protein
MADNGTKIRRYIFQKQGLSVLETIGPQVVSPLSRKPRMWRGFGWGKDFYYFKMPRPALGTNQSFFF